MESWQRHPEHPQILVSDRGEVARILTASKNEAGYTRVNVLTTAGRRVTRLVHQLVLEAFVGPRERGQQVRHLNDVRDDNRLENLAWGSPSENTADAFSNGGRTLKTHCRLGHPIEGLNLQARGRRCKACNRARAQAHNQGIPFTKELADQRFKEVMSE